MSKRLLSEPKLKSELRTMSKLLAMSLSQVDAKAGRLQNRAYYKRLAKKQFQHMMKLPRPDQVSLIEEMRSVRKWNDSDPYSNDTRKKSEP